LSGNEGWDPKWRYARGVSKEPAARLPYLALARETPNALLQQRGREAAPRVPSSFHREATNLTVMHHA
jgi:hypothetical protein